MSPRLPLLRLALGTALSMTAVGLMAQCTNTSQYPSATIVPNSSGAVTSISTCSFLEEYSVVGSIVSGATYQFTCTGGAYVTVHSGTSDGPVLGNGTSPLTVTTTSTDNLYAHWNSNDQCGTASGTCQITTVQLFLNCVPPTATVTAVDDCTNNEFSLSVNVTSLGDATAVDLIYTVNGGAEQTLAAQPVGSYDLGPFTVGDVVNVTVAHSSDAACNLHFNNQVSGTCPIIIDCGGSGLTSTFCYSNNMDTTMVYQGNGAFPLALLFNAGQMESCCDNVTIYDGLTATGTPLYQGNNAGASMAGIQVISTNPDHALTMVFHSDGSVSCGSQGYPQLDWVVSCLNCTQPEATFTVITDCDNYEFTVEVDITALGSDPVLDITNDGGAPALTADAIGTYTVGPFVANQPVHISLVNDANNLCNLNSGLLVNPICPVIIDCGGSGINSTFCYADNMDTTMVYQGNGAFPLALLFNAGQMESCCDNVTIYDGPTATGIPLYQGNNGGATMAGILVVSTNPDHALTMVFHSDGSVNCGSQGYPQLDWIVSCLNCIQPEATFTVNTDCDNYQFTVDVEITTLGSDPTLDITNDGGAPALTADATGTYTVGPFPANVPVHISLVNDANNLCNLNSSELVNPLCPLDIVCGVPAVEETYCYTNDDVHAWHWHSTTPGVGLGIHFSSGTIQGNFGFPYGESLRIYDGPDNTAPLLYQQIDFNTINLAGLQFISSQEDIYMEMTSDGFGSCEDGITTPWAWEVSCADCTPPVANFTINTDCDAFTYTVSVDITEMGSDDVIDIINDGGASPVPATALGTYTVGPFTAGTVTNITLVNDVNSLCNLYSGALVNPLCPQTVECGGDPLAQTYCYSNYDTMAWAWQSSGNEPLIITFSAGYIEGQFFVYDHLRIYDGTSNTAPLIYENLVGTATLAGVEAIASSGNMYMEMTSDVSGSCSGSSQPEWAWDIGCLDCTNATATYSVVPDCLHHTYQVAVNISSTGSAPTVRIVNSAAGDTLSNVGAGITLTAPIPMDSVTLITVLNETNDLCRIYSDSLNSASSDCDIPSCEQANYTYCYPNSDTAWYTYVGTSTEPLTITFAAGQLLLNDYVEIYDGANPLAPLLYTGNNGGNMAGVSYNSTNPEHTITLRVVSDGQYSCATGEATQVLSWDVLCGYVGISERSTTSFGMYPNPTTGMVDMVLPASVKGAVDVRVLDIAGRTVYHETLNVNASSNTLDLQGLQSGNYTVTITTEDNTGAQRLQIVR